MRWRSALLLVLTAASLHGGVVAEVGFVDEALGPLPDGPAPTAAQCGACHARIYDEWKGSLHRQSVTNAVFVDGLANEPHPRCVYCHAPLAPQAADTLKQLRTVVRTRALNLPSTSLAHEGISCAVCHVRAGRVFAAQSPGHAYAHEVQVSARLKDSSFCAACHEFRAHEVHDGKTVMTPAPMQSTFSEWRAYRDAGGTETCQSCHMPGTSHAFRGAHDVALLRGALKVVLDGDTAVLSSQGVGHSFPTGDVFRHLTLWADDVELARFGRRFAVSVGEDGRGHVELAADTSLQPGVPVRVKLPAGAHRLRVTYHYADDRHEQQGHLAREDLVVTLWLARVR
ncbi:MAG: multiheme c-type cytochrome [Myxococcota bacterium]